MDKVFNFLWMPAHYTLLTEALAIAIEKLQKHAVVGNTSVQERLKEYQWLRGRLAEKTPPDGEGPAIEQLGLEPVKAIRAALILYLPMLEAERDSIAATAEVSHGATEGIEKKIGLAKDFIIGPALGSVEPDPIFKVVPPRLAEREAGLVFRTALNSYTVVERGPNGGSGQIFRVVDDSGLTWAIKKLNPETATTDKLKRFRNELAFCQRNSHPNIVTVLDAGIHGEQGKEMPFYVMQFYPKTLRTLIQEGMPPGIALARFRQILEGMREAHSKGVAHRDLKPENVLYDPEKDTMLVADFGIAHFSEELLVTSVETQKGARIGNFQYAAPEQRTRGAVVSSMADIFSLGLILNEIFTRELALGVRYRTIGSVAADFIYLDAVVQDMLQNNPGSRPKDLEAVSKLIDERGRAFRSGERTLEEFTQDGGVTVDECDISIPGICELPGDGTPGTVLIFHDGRSRQVNGCRSCSNRKFDLGEWRRAEA